MAKRVPSRTADYWYFTLNAAVLIRTYGASKHSFAFRSPVAGWRAVGIDRWVRDVPRVKTEPQ